MGGRGHHWTVQGEGAGEIDERKLHPEAWPGHHSAAAAEAFAKGQIDPFSAVSELARPVVENQEPSA